MTSCKQIIGILRNAGVDEKTISSAANTLKGYHSTVLVVSGKMGAGKDTVAPLVMEYKGRPGVRLSFATCLKEEVSDIISIIRQENSVAKAVRDVSKSMNVTIDVASHIVSILWDEVKADTSATLSGSSRTPALRAALQYWGTDVRRTQDPDYWVNRTLRLVAAQLAGGFSVYLTDARFPNEVSMLREIGAFTLRLEVSPEEQARRLTERDHRPPSAESLAHDSETALDTYDRFHVTIDTTHLSPDQIALAAAAEWTPITYKD